jgi:hypothetical protein
LNLSNQIFVPEYGQAGKITDLPQYFSDKQVLKAILELFNTTNLE